MELKEVVTHFSDLSFVPITLFENGTEIFQIPELPYLHKLVSVVPDELTKTEKSADCLLTDDLLLFGIVKVRNSTSHLIFGPISSLPCDNQNAQKILRGLRYPTTETSDLLGYLSNTPKYSLSKFADLIIFANYIINHETMIARDLLPDVYRNELSIPMEMPDAPASKELDVFHSGQSFERKMFALVKFGKVDDLTTFTQTMHYAGNEGKLAKDMLRQYKNLIIASTTLAGRAAVDGGLDYESAMRHSDMVMQKVEMATDVETLAVIHNTMLRTFTKKVADRKIGNPNSAISSKVQRYIEQNINHKIDEGEIAKALGISRSYLCVQFKKETGKNLNGFIQEIKIDEAKMLLSTSNKSAVSISTILDFSSQSYFQNIFKKHTGMTPKQYREKNQ